MKILQINTAAGRGVAGGVPDSIQEMGRSLGHEMLMAVGRGNSAGGHTPLSDAFSTGVHWAATRLCDRHGLHSRAATRRLIAKAETFAPDVIHLHNIHGYYLHYPTLFDWLRGSGCPVVWTLHDCWPLTGHCAFFRNCERWRSGCHKCPLLRTYPASLLADRSKANHKLKRNTFAKLQRCTIVPVSDWLDKVAGQSLLGHYPRRVIRNGIDLGIFRPCAPKPPSDSPLVLGVASHWDERKGLKDFRALRQMLPAHWRMRLIGLDSRQRKRLSPDIEGLGRINSAAELARHYSEATVFVNPTQAEGDPLTKMEALACGTPVVTYDSGGAAEGLTPETGTAVGKDCVDALTRETERCATGHYSAKACRELAEKRFDMRRNLSGYFDLYAELHADKR